MLPLHLVMAALVGWLEREQRDVIEFLREENRVLKAPLRGRRMRLTTTIVGVSQSSAGASAVGFSRTSRRSSRPTPFSDGTAS